MKNIATGFSTHWTAALALTAVALLAGCASGPRVVEAEVTTALAASVVLGQPTMQAVPLPAQAVYRFERTPLQASLAQQHATAAQRLSGLEATAATQLAKAGWTQAAPGAESTARYAISLQVGEVLGSRSDRDFIPRPHPGYRTPSGWPYTTTTPFNVGVNVGVGIGRGVGVFGSFPVWQRIDTPWYWHEAKVTVREIASPPNTAAPTASGAVIPTALMPGAVVAEILARHDGPWADAPRTLAALVQAALLQWPPAVSGGAPLAPRVVKIELAK